MNRCHICGEDAGNDYHSDERSKGAPNDFGSVLHYECWEQVATWTDAEFMAVAEEDACPECGRFNAHEGICAGPDDRPGDLPAGGGVVVLLSETEQTRRR